MNTYLSYPWALLYGWYMYVGFHLMFLMRFGRLNLSFNYLDIGIVIVGFVSVLGALYYARKLEAQKRMLMLIPFVIAIPFAYVGSLMGGLLGFFGIVILGLIPFAIALPIGYAILRRAKGIGKKELRQ